MFDSFIKFCQFFITALLILSQGTSQGSQGFEFSQVYWGFIGFFFYLPQLPQLTQLIICIEIFKCSSSSIFLKKAEIIKKKQKGGIIEVAKPARALGHSIRQQFKRYYCGLLEASNGVPRFELGQIIEWSLSTSSEGHLQNTVRAVIDHDILLYKYGRQK